ncbi:MAG TPA: ATP-binding protein [Vicinamibacterales bacterium]|nr:ATP-binding protein [Vicinamibacterales bacterium]
MSLISSLTNRIFFASALVVVIAIGFAIYTVNTSVTNQAETDLRSGLAEAASLVDQLSRRQFADFAVKGSLIADLPKLSNAAAVDDPPTVQPIAEDYQKKIAADLFVVLGSGDRVLADAGRIRLAPADIVELASACRKSSDSTSFREVPGGIVHAVAFALDPIRTLIVGFGLDREFAAGIKAVTESDIAIIAEGRIVASTLDADKTSALLSPRPPIGEFERRLGSEDYVGRVQSLGATSGPQEPVALVLRSRTQRLGFLPGLHLQIVLAGLAAVLLATIVGYAIARTVTRPVRALTATMSEMAATGDLARTVAPAGPWDDEDARALAAAFRQLASALDRFQREAAQRERLASLGRLSTVVAHEIRNPLMIIKSAVRNLRKHTSPETVSVAENIDEEVQRLNRVVSDVLDFARPIRYDLAPADLVEICRDAAQAAQAGPDDVPVKLDASAGAPIVTDRERVRSVLVNVLANAQQAVRSVPAPTPARGKPPIELRAWAAGPGRWRIEVSDRGPGIAREDLPRLFEPFFTTRRTGSGLGLAIARNIIEGLGGSIVIDSRPNVGTTVRIELPDQPPPAREASA